VGRLAESVEEGRQAIALDPVAPVLRTFTARTYSYLQQPDRAIEFGQQALAIDPNFPPAHDVLGWAYLEKAMYTEGLAEIHKFVHLQGDRDEGAIKLALAYAAARQRALALRYLETVKALAKRQYVSPADIAAIYAALGEKEQALTWLEKAYAEHDGNLADIKVFPFYANLRSEPRFAAIVRGMGLSP
jgi:serine/threonine-protein kinase